MSDATKRLYEQLLVLRCQAGEESAFEELVIQYSPRLKYYLRRIVPREHQVEDVLQEVWLAAFRALPRLNDGSAVGHWLYRIARDKAAVLWRRQRQPAHSLEDANIAIEPDEPTEFGWEDAQEIHAALDQLSRDHREVLVLRFLEDMTYDQIAGVTGCPTGTVRSRLYYAKLALRRVIERRRKK